MPLWKVLASPFITLQQALTVGEDCWTWTTLNGDEYEDVELLSQDRQEVTIRHKFGVSTIAKTELNHRIQKSLVDNFEMAEPDYSDDSALEPYLNAHPLSHGNRLSGVA